MELRDLYKLSELIKENVDNGNLPQEMVKDMEISLQFNPSTYYGIDKEFYYILFYVLFICEYAFVF